MSPVADSASIPRVSLIDSAANNPPRHMATVRVTHWIAALCFLALLVTGIEILISHPRFYWGETGNSGTPALFELPIPASRATVQTGYAYVLPDQNGWSRSLHFQAAWGVVLTGLLYVIFGVVTGHFRRDLLPPVGERSWRALSAEIGNHLRLKPGGNDASYNSLQRVAYIVVIFVLFPGMIWTGLAMSPAFTSAFPATVEILGGQQSARTIHFIVALSLVLFVLVHVAMVVLAGFESRMRAMISGSAKEQA